MKKSGSKKESIDDLIQFIEDKSRESTQEPAVINDWFKRATPRLAEFNADQLIVCLEAVARIGQYESIFLSKWVSKFITCSGVGAVDLSKMLACLSKLEFKDQRFLNYYREKVTDLSTNLISKPLGTVIHDIAKLQSFDDITKLDAPNKAIWQEYIADLMRVAQQKLTSFDMEDLSNVIWGANKLSFYDQVFLDQWCELVVVEMGFPNFNPNDLMKVIGSVAKLGYYNEDLVNKWIDIFKNKEKSFSLRNKINAAFYLTMICDNQMINSDLKTKIENCVNRVLSNIDINQVLSLEQKTQLLVVMNKSPDQFTSSSDIKLIKQWKNDVEINANPIVSSTQKIVSEFIDSEMKVSMKQESWLNESQSNVDIFIAFDANKTNKKGLVIQVDGPSHYQFNHDDMMNATTRFNSNLLKNNFEVIRIKYSDIDNGLYKNILRSEILKHQQYFPGVRAESISEVPDVLRLDKDPAKRRKKKKSKGGKSADPSFTSSAEDNDGFAVEDIKKAIELSSEEASGFSTSQDLNIGTTRHSQVQGDVKVSNQYGALELPKDASFSHQAQVIPSLPQSQTQGNKTNNKKNKGSSKEKDALAKAKEKSENEFLDELYRSQQPRLKEEEAIKKSKEVAEAIKNKYAQYNPREEGIKKAIIGMDSNSFQKFITEYPGMRELIKENGNGNHALSFVVYSVSLEINNLENDLSQEIEGLDEALKVEFNTENFRQIEEKTALICRIIYKDFVIEGFKKFKTLLNCGVVLDQEERKLYNNFISKCKQNDILKDVLLISEEDDTPEYVSEFFIKAAQYNNLFAMKLILARSKKLNPNAIDERGFTALHHAVIHDSKEITEFLLNDLHVNPNTFCQKYKLEDVYYITPLFTAVYGCNLHAEGHECLIRKENNNKYLVGLLLEAGANIDIRSNEFHLISFAIKAGCINLIKKVVEEDKINLREIQLNNEGKVDFMALKISIEMKQPVITELIMSSFKGKDALDAQQAKQKFLQDSQNPIQNSGAKQIEKGGFAQDLQQQRKEGISKAQGSTAEDKKKVSEKGGFAQAFKKQQKARENSKSLPPR